MKEIMEHELSGVHDPEIVGCVLHFAGNVMGHATGGAGAGFVLSDDYGGGKAGIMPVQIRSSAIVPARHQLEGVTENQANYVGLIIALAEALEMTRDGCPISARQVSAEDFFRLDALLFTAMAWIFIPAYCFAIP